MKRQPRGANQESLDRYRMEQTRCEVCWLRAGFGWPPHAVHHIIHRSRRRCDEPWNLLLVCGELCHGLFHGDRVKRADGSYWPPLSLANALWVKRESGLWRPDLLAVLYQPSCPGALPEPEPLGEFYLRARERNRIGYSLPERSNG